MRRVLGALACLLLLALPACGLGQTRALLVACKEFVSQPDLGSSVSGNLHMIGSALVGAGLRMGELFIEDGTVGTPDALGASVARAFDGAQDGDLSILYLCTHGLLSSSDDEQVYLLLGDGKTESSLGAAALYALLSGVPGEKLLIVDACFSGALIGRGAPASPLLPGAHRLPAAVSTPFLADPSIHVLTSADGYESSWYYDSEGLTTGAVSYFASALASGLGLYGAPEADANGDGGVTLAELHRHLRMAVPSSGSQLLSARAESLHLPVSGGAALSRPLFGFSYGDSLLRTDDPTLEFSFTVAREASVQYRVIDYDAGRWNWEQAETFLDEEGALSPGRKTRALTLSDIAPDESGYVMLQIFSVEGDEVTLCSERLLAVQPAESDAQLSVSTPGTLLPDGAQELPIAVALAVPAELTVSVFDDQGALVRRLAAGQLTRPAPDNANLFYWDGRDAQGNPVPAGEYAVAAEAFVGGARRKAAANVTIGGM